MPPDSSTDRPRVGIATEGPASKAVAEAICTNAGIVHRVLCSQGKERLFHDFGKMLNSLRAGFGAERFLVLPDLHPETDCAAEAIRWNVEIGRQFPTAILCLAIWETESWLVADENAFNAYLGSTGAVLPPDRVGGTKPSAWIHDIFRRVKGYPRGAAFDKRTDGAGIAMAMDLEVAGAKSASLQHFLAKAR